MVCREDSSTLDEFMEMERSSRREEDRKPLPIVLYGTDRRSAEFQPMVRLG
jgi:hypothetical protein